MASELITVVVVVGALAVMFGVWVVIVIRFYRKIGPNEALVITTPNGVHVERRGRIVIPFLHQAESVDLSTKQLRVERKGREAPTTKDGVQTDLVVVFYLHVNDTHEDVLKAAKRIGTERLRDATALKELLAPQLASAIDTLTRALVFENLEREREKVEDELTKIVDENLDGLTVDRAVLERVERTPVEQAGPFR